MKNKLLALLLSAGVAVVLGLIVWQSREISRLRGRVSATEGAGPLPAGTALPATPPAAAPLTGERAASPPILNRPQPTRGPAPAPTPSAAPGKSAPASATGQAPEGASPMENMTKLLKSPGMKEIMRAQHRAGMDRTHGALFEYLALSPEDLATFKDLLMEKQMAVMDNSLELMDASATTAERSNLAARIKAVNDDYDNRIRAFLGEEDYALFKEFEATQPERMQVGLLKQSLSAADALDAATEDELIRAMHEERTNFRFTVKLDESEGLSPASLSDDTLSRYTEELGRLQERYSERAAQLLSPGQLQQFKQNLEQQRLMQQMAMKMAAQMFAKPGAASEPAQPSPIRGQE